MSSQKRVAARITTGHGRPHDPEVPRRRVAILGGGIAGLATAFYLAQEGDCDITVYEGQPTLGGQMYTHLVDGVPVEHTCRIFPRNYRVWYEMMAALGWTDRFTERDIVTIDRGVQSRVRANPRKLPAMRMAHFIGWYATTVFQGLFLQGDRTLIEESTLFAHEALFGFERYDNRSVQDFYSLEHARGVQHLTGIKLFHAIGGIRKQTHDRLATLTSHWSTNPAVMMTATSAEVVAALQDYVMSRGVSIRTGLALASLEFAEDNRVKRATLRSTRTEGETHVIDADHYVLALGLTGLVGFYGAQLPDGQRALSRAVPGVERLQCINQDQEFSVHLFLTEEPTFMDDSVYVAMNSQWALSFRKLPITPMLHSDIVKRVVIVCVNEETTPGQYTGKSAVQARLRDIEIEIFGQLGEFGERLRAITHTFFMDPYWKVLPVGGTTSSISEAPHPIKRRCTCAPSTTCVCDPQPHTDHDILDLTPLPRPLPGQDHYYLADVAAASANLSVGGEGVMTPYGLQFVESSCWTGKRIAERLGRK